MALSKNNIAIPFSTGLSTKTDDLQQQLEGLTSLQNVIFDTPKKLRKRNGYSKVDLTTINSPSITGSKFLANFSQELGLLTDDNYYAYAESINKWSNKGRVFSVFPSSNSILRNNLEQNNVDTVSVENISAYVFEDSDGVKISIVDNSNSNFLTSNKLISATGTVPRVVNIENILYVFFADGTDIKYRKINILTPQTIEAEQVFSSTLESSDNNFDCTTIDDRIYVALNSSASGGSVSAGYIDSGDNISSFLTFAGEDATNAISTCTDSSSRLIITYSTGSEVKIIILPFTLLSPILTATTVESISDAVNVTAVESSATNYDVYYEISAPSVKNHYIKKSTASTDGTIGASSTLIKSVGLNSKAFKHNDNTYISTIHESTLQSTYFIVEDSGAIISKFSPNLGGKLITENVLSKVVQLDSSNFNLATQIKGRSVIDDDQFFSLLGVNSTTLNFNLEDPFQNEQLGPNLHIAGGIPMMYDGQSVTEHGFHIFPEDLTEGSTATVGGSIGDGIYQYSAVYAWTDNKGQLHRSAPSIGLPITLSGGTATQTQTIEIPTLRLTQKENVTIELYRTEAAGTIFYKITEVSNPLNNDTMADTVSFLDDVSDTDLISKEVLYTTGGVLDNISAPSSSIIESFSSRIFLAGLEDGNKLQYSKIRFEDVPVEFNDTLTIQVNSKGGNITALKTMDEKLIIFKESAIFYLSGDGPNNLGAQDTFISPELISSDIGCINVNSVVLTPDGVMFKSKKGIYLLSRSLQLAYIGSDVEKFNDLKVSSAVVVPEENQVRFTTEDGEALVYNYYTRMWATFTNHKALSGINIGFTYYYLRSDGILYVEDEEGFTDNGSSINMSLESGWISFAGVQAFQRVYKLLLLGEFKSPHKLRVRIAYDFVEAYTQEVIIDTADFTDNTRYGGYSPYGTGTPYGGTGNVHQVRVDLKQQKCQSIKISIEEIQSDTANYGEGLTINNLLFQIGAKKGTNKMDTGKQYGTN